MSGQVILQFSCAVLLMFYEIFYFVCELTKYVFFVQVQRMLMENFNRQAVG